MSALDHYQLLSELGRGGFGVVYRARDTRLHREVAIKLLLRGGQATPTQLARFRREGEALARLNHPHVVPIHSTGESAEGPFMVLQFVEGSSLDERLRTQGPLDPDDAVDLVRKVAGAVAAAHGIGVLHRDIKPANVLLTEDGEPLLTDFGLARQSAPPAGAERLSKTGVILGTPGYCSPEQVAAQGVGTASDVYGLGALLYAALTGGPPIEAGTLVQLCVATVSTRPLPPSGQNPAVPRALDEIVLRCLEKAPEERFESADALIAALDALSEAPPPRRGPLVLGALATLALVVGVIAWPRGADPPPPPPTPDPTPEALPEIAWTTAPPTSASLAAWSRAALAEPDSPGGLVARLQLACALSRDPTPYRRSVAQRELAALRADPRVASYAEQALAELHAHAHETDRALGYLAPSATLPPELARRRQQLLAVLRALGPARRVPEATLLYRGPRGMELLQVDKRKASAYAARDGSGAFRFPSFDAPTRTWKLPGLCLSLPAIGDWDGDGVDDVALVLRLGKDDERILLMPDGERSDWKELVRGVGKAMCRWGDVDGDGRQDLVVPFAQNNARSRVVFGGMGKTPAFPVPDAQLQFEFETLVPVDLDGDGRDELISAPSHVAQGGPQVFAFDPATHRFQGSAALPPLGPTSVTPYPQGRGAVLSARRYDDGSSPEGVGLFLLEESEDQLAIVAKWTYADDDPAGLGPIHGFLLETSEGPWLARASRQALDLLPKDEAAPGRPPVFRLATLGHDLSTHWIRDVDQDGLVELGVGLRVLGVEAPAVAPPSPAPNPDGGLRCALALDPSLELGDDPGVERTRGEVLVGIARDLRSAALLAFGATEGGSPEQGRALWSSMEGLAQEASRLAAATDDPALLARARRLLQDDVGELRALERANDPATAERQATLEKLTENELRLATHPHLQVDSPLACRVAGDRITLTADANSASSATVTLDALEAPLVVEGVVAVTDPSWATHVYLGFSQGSENRAASVSLWSPTQVRRAVCGIVTRSHNPAGATTFPLRLAVRLEVDDDGALATYRRADTGELVLARHLPEFTLPAAPIRFGVRCPRYGADVARYGQQLRPYGAVVSITGLRLLARRADTRPPTALGAAHTSLSAGRTAAAARGYAGIATDSLEGRFFGAFANGRLGKADAHAGVVAAVNADPYRALLWLEDAATPLLTGSAADRRTARDALTRLAQSETPLVSLLARSLQGEHLSFDEVQEEFPSGGRGVDRAAWAYLALRTALVAGGTPRVTDLPPSSRRPSMHVSPPLLAFADPALSDEELQRILDAHDANCRHCSYAALLRLRSARPRSAVALQQEGSLLNSAGFVGMARRRFQQALPLAPQEQALSLHHRILLASYRMGLVEESLDALEQVAAHPSVRREHLAEYGRYLGEHPRYMAIMKRLEAEGR